MVGIRVKSSGSNWAYCSKVLDLTGLHCLPYLPFLPSPWSLRNSYVPILLDFPTLPSSNIGHEKPVRVSIVRDLLPAPAAHREIDIESFGRWIVKVVA